MFYISKTPSIFLKTLIAIVALWLGMNSFARASLVLDFSQGGTVFTTPDARTLIGTFTDPGTFPAWGGDFVFSLTATAPTFFGTDWVLNRHSNGLGVDTTTDSVTGIFANAEDPNEIDNLEAVRVRIQSVDPEKAILVHSVSPSSTGGGVTFVTPSPSNSVFFDIQGGSLGAALTGMHISVIPSRAPG